MQLSSSCATVGSQPKRSFTNYNSWMDDCGGSYIEHVVLSKAGS